MLPVRPRIDYQMLGQAVHEYQLRGYRYVECPWMVPDKAIRATLPGDAPYWEAAVRCDYDEGRRDAFVESYGLVGSAEQSFLTLDLPPGPYVGITPCFRWEVEENIFTRYTFMKVELFVTSEDAEVQNVMDDAYEVMSLLGNTSAIQVTGTEEGFDFNLFGVEVGSYGERATTEQAWIYGTGLALPRFSVALALRSIA